ncbi:MULTISPECIES: 2-isopropylmalate synthase [unclassified Enterococcus]|uniref:2-isopropylmalate synthase n=1 Tax=unclassified Enterococcus TaxID=2608891 RepID=UPI0015520A31|nr:MULTISPECIES: 2-isopropylmalate synthase [unclassified Enterococcus]MBS7578063.1 2-isopropylmalate synthase [Enterococcus sp. MMGLQ5-2]MBS7585323.1 2-isopropylmalate synthase [Enterococcus sp. MMGLQ5-1]NPD13180.1 2-isopropylmalate synthase [Enterococcus sp. MMGLQ5-1]NPD37894.1 2-isopropylmalate synthase [Enterococcus sp. MMGLQ5-2]
MEKVQFFDTTLRDGEQTPGVSFSTKEKVAVALQLEKWGVDVIEAGFPASSNESFKAVQEIAKVATKLSVTGLARLVKNDIDKAYEALKDARYPQIHVFIATSPVHMEYKLKMTPEQVLASIKEHVSYAREKFEIVQFSPEDATRSEKAFLLEAVQAAVDAGASVINVPDTVGYSNPEEYGAIFKYLIENIKTDREIIYSPHCHDDLGMATANSLAAIKNGARRVEGTVNGLGERAGNTALEEVAVALKIRQDYYQVESGIVLKETKNTSDLISRFSAIAVPKNKAVVGGNAFAHESGIHQDGFLKNPSTYEIITPEMVGVAHSSLPLGKLSGRHAFNEKLKELGFELSENDLKAAFSDFKDLADKKNDISDADLRALIAGQTVQQTDSFVFNTLDLSYHSNGEQEATVYLVNVNGETVAKSATGKGSVEAIFAAIDEVFSQNVALNSYEIAAITSGVDAQAEVRVSVENPETGTIFNAVGIDYDILKASALAYMNANIVVQKENLKLTITN